MDTLNTHTPMNRTLAVIDGGGNVTANVPSPPKSQNPKLLDHVRQAIRARHYSDKTEKAYVHWIKRYIFFHDKRHPQEMAEAEIASFLSSFASDGHVSASTQNQAFNALLFLYKEVLGKKIGLIDGVVRAKRPPEIAGRAQEGGSEKSDRSDEQGATFDGDTFVRGWFAADGMLSSPSQRYRFFSQRDRRASRQRR